MQRILTVLFLFLISISSALSQAKPCDSPNFRAFDFWLGDWKVTSHQNGSFAGYSSIEIMLDSCVILENWYGSSNSIGKSFNHYDVATGKWKQKWVDNFASNIEFMGMISNDTAHYYANTLNPANGNIVYNHMMIAKVNQNEVRQLWQQSNDSTNWTTAFDGKYERIESITKAMLNEEIDAVYKQFADAYDQLNPNMVSDLYIEDAHYLSGPGLVQIGNDLVHQTFAGFFDSMAKSERTMKIQFHIINRHFDERMAADIGYFLLTYYSKDGEANESAGKFSTVLKKMDTGEWKFLSDSYLNAPVESVKSYFK